MSCHDIGRGMNSVIEVVIGLYDDGKISTESAGEIIKACRRGVHWCDGNEGEAVGALAFTRCGVCLKKIPEGKELYDLVDAYGVEVEHTDCEKIFQKAQYELAYPSVCGKCMDKIITEWTGNSEISSKIKKALMEKCPEECVSRKTRY